MSQMDVPLQLVLPLVDAALAEDVGNGDVTTLATVAETATAEAEILAKEEGVLCGLPVAEAMGQQDDPDCVRVGKRLYHRQELAELASRIGELVAAYAGRFPLRLGIPKEEARRKCKFPGGSAEWNAVVQHLSGEGTWAVVGDRIGLTPEGPPLAPALAAAVGKAAVELAGFGLDWPGLDEWAEGSAVFRAAAADASLADFKPQEVIRHLVDHGQAVAVNNDYHVAVSAREELLSRLRRYFAKEEELPFAQFRELSGLTRKLGIPLLEHLDQMGVTVRSGDVRRPGPALAADTENPGR